ncbi:hypothetical protein EBZ39_02220 [bacterium]|nr:hypothetical protein [bacterium]
MRPSVVGELNENSQKFLDPAWHRNLTELQLAAYIRYQFIRISEHALSWDSIAQSRRRPHWDGGTDAYGVRRSNVWAQIGRNIRKFSAHPGIWVCAHFSPAADLKLTVNTQSLPEVRPTNLQSAKSLQIYEKYLSMLGSVLRHDFELADQTVSMRFKTTAGLDLPINEQVEYVLCDESYVTATPFFRHVFAAAAGCEAAMQRYLFAAAVDYEVHQDSYTALTKQIGQHASITDSIIAATVRIRQHWEEFRG